ncbi:hypothetical protein [Caballeronia glathei]|jgi:hypothetical protein|nr:MULTISPECIES: hypothetical protein [Burkholderiaceae]
MAFLPGWDAVIDFKSSKDKSWLSVLSVWGIRKRFASRAWRNAPSRQAIWSRRLKFPGNVPLIRCWRAVSRGSLCSFPKTIEFVLMKLPSKITLLALASLAACGGGGSDETCTTSGDLQKTCIAKPSHSIPEGIWFGATTTGLAAQTIVLETGQYFSVYTLSGNLAWLTEGIVTATDGAFSDPATVAVDYAGAIIAGTLAGNFTAKSTLAATTSINTTPNTTALSFNGNYNSTYDTPLAISDVLGTWNNPMTIATTATVTFSSDGSATGAQGACTFTGSFRPRATGKHILDGTLTFTDASCATGNGVAMPVEATVVNNQLSIVGVTPQRSTAFYLAATR